MDRNTNIFTWWRTPNPRRELLVWLVLIWTPVFYIYKVSNHTEVLLPDSSPPIPYPFDHKKDSPPEKKPTHDSSNKQEDTANFPVNPAPSVKSSMRKESNLNVIKKETVNDAQDHNSARNEGSNDE